MTATQHSDQEEPFVSVIIPVYNDPEGIETTLDSLLDQTYDRYEIVGVDNNSTDETSDVLKRMSTAHPTLISQCEETTIQSSYAARNTGIQHADGELLLFIDADMWVAEHWIEKMVAAVVSDNYDYLGCNVELVTTDQPTVWERYQQALAFPVESYLEREQFAPTCALAVRREVFEQVGRFDDRLESSGDKEFGQRVHRAGLKQGYAADVTVYHPARDSWTGMCAKALRIGRGRTQMRRYHPDSSGSHHLLHPVNYLPPSPFRLRQRFSGQDFSLQAVIGFYLLEYVLKLTQIYGMLRELRSQSGEDGEAS